MSKAIFNLDNDVIYDLKDLNNKCKIAIQTHIFYEDLIEDIINKTNNIPVKFDLYITITSPELKSRLENDIKIYSKTNYFEILIVENKGRDVLPFLRQIKTKFKYYKYLCHIHTKKHFENDILGKYWQVYLYENLLGNKKIVSTILTDFENHNKLGLIFPENFYLVLKYIYNCNPSNTKHLNNLLGILFPDKKLKVGNIFNFPAGNMFWARTISLYQIFNDTIIKSAPEEKGQIGGTILHAIERIWI
jgi:lipopolysaccharide biosynthesis protein